MVYASKNQSVDEADTNVYDEDMVYEMCSNVDYDDFDVVYETRTIDFSGVVHESKKLFGYRGTKKLEKKYDIPDDLCIERGDFGKLNKDDAVLKKIEKAAKYIKDQDDLNTYFCALLQRAFYRNNIKNAPAYNKRPNIAKLYNMYTKTYKGKDVLTKEELYKYVADTQKNLQTGNYAELV